MTREQLRSYLKQHRDDQEAFETYIDKLATEPTIATHSLSDKEPLADVIMRVNEKSNNL